MPKLPEYIQIQIDDFDDCSVYYSATAEEKDTPFPPSQNHPTGIYKLVKYI